MSKEPIMEWDSVSVPGWKCGLCGNVHGTKEDADGCCTCSGCGAKFAKSVGYRSRCDACDYGVSLRNARDACERAATELTRTHGTLRHLIEHPPSGKRRPKLGLPPMPVVEPVPYVHGDGTVDKSVWGPLYVVRDFLLDQAEAAQLVNEGSTEAEDCRKMAVRIEDSIARTGGGSEHRRVTEVVE